MHETLPFISAARRLRAGRAPSAPAPERNGHVAPISPVPQPTLDDFERDVHAVREAIFELTDTARNSVSHENTQVHVSLQIVSNELGQVERMLADARAAQADTAATA